MRPTDNIVYFTYGDNLIDIRLCPKNGHNTLKLAWIYSNGSNLKLTLSSGYDDSAFLQPYSWLLEYTDLTDKPEDLSSDQIKEIIRRVSYNRYNKIDNLTPNNIVSNTPQRFIHAQINQDIFNIPFRKKSWKIAVKRDPIERFRSAVKYLHSSYKKETYAEDKRVYTDLSDIDLNNIDKVLDCLENGKIKDEHFFTQSYYMGHVNMYDEVFDIKDLHLLLEKIQGLGTFMNEDITKIKLNETSEEINIVLTTEQKSRIIKLYAQDYANGWC